VRGIAAFVALIAATPLPAQAPPVTPQRTIDWAALPPLPLREPPRMIPAMSQFVLREVRARRCPLPPHTPAGWRLRVELAVLIDEEAEVRTIIPRAINCPAVEQYAVGLVASFARANLSPRAGGVAQWYQTALEFGGR